MRKIFIFVAILSLTSIALAGTMYIHLNDGTTEEIELNDINNITFGEIGNTYYEDFSTNPGFTSMAPEYAYWDSENGNYFVNCFDNLENYYWAYSPIFGPINTNIDVTIELDAVWENMDWGTYPGVGFYNCDTPMRDSTHILYILGRWADGTYKKIRINNGDNQYLSNNEIVNNLWYHISILYDANNLQADIEVTELDSGDLFWSLENIDFELNNDIRTLGVGYYSQENYGDEWSPIRIDNIQIY